VPIGTEVLAARAGTVLAVRDDSPDNGHAYGEHNYVFVKNDDGSVAFYAHLMQDGVLVAFGDTVAAGDLIGYSGRLSSNRRPSPSPLRGLPRLAPAGGS
jgi:murein DD-endopeptidase MepM/ murein hydrolase activator NlpD